MGKRTRTGDQQPFPKRPSPMLSYHEIFEGTQYSAVKEGLATLLFPLVKRSLDDMGMQAFQDDVFYNPIQQFNRDMSVLAIKTFGEIYMSEMCPPKKHKNDHLVDASLNMTPLVLDSANSYVFECDTTESTIYPQNAEDLTSSALLSPTKFRVLDALSATGLRAIRFSLEIPFITSITANDVDPTAVQSILKNIAYNKQKAMTISPEKITASKALSQINVNLGNAQHHMYSAMFSTLSTLNAKGNFEGITLNQSAKGKYEVIDLDPYGTAAPFLDAAVQALSNGGMLCVTCTDAGVWASTGYGEKCFSLYGGIPAKSEWCHEAGLRLILYSIATSAAKYGLSIEPLLSMSIDFYARLFVKIQRSPIHVKNFASNSMIVYNCGEGCSSWVVQPLGKSKSVPHKNGQGAYMKYGLAKAPISSDSCPECGFNMQLAGPMWKGALHSSNFVNHFLYLVSKQSEAIYSTLPRITGMLQTIAQEVKLAEHPFFHVPSRLSRTLRCEAPPQAAVRGALIGLGYKVARSHCKPNSIKTDAPHNVVWDIMKKWVERKPVRENALKEGTPGFAIMQKCIDPNLNIKLDESLGKEETKPDGVVRYQINPTANWGPMGKAKVTKNNSINAGTNPREEPPEKRMK